MNNSLSSAISSIGTLSSLNTTAKTNLVAAVNEVRSETMKGADLGGNAASSLNGFITACFNKLKAGQVGGFYGTVPGTDSFYCLIGRTNATAGVGIAFNSAMSYCYFVKITSSGSTITTKRATVT